MLHKETRFLQTEGGKGMGRRKWGGRWRWRIYILSKVVVALSFNSTPVEAETDVSLSSRPAFSTEQGTGQSGLYRDTLSPKAKGGKKESKSLDGVFPFE